LPIRPRTPPRARSELLRHWTLWVWFAGAVFLSVGGVCLWRSGRWLVHEDAFDHVKWALVLAGESRDCERTDAAIRLFQEGKVDTLILSGCRIFKNRYQSEFMSEYAVQQGVPRERVFEFRQDTYSTQQEARQLVRQFRLQNLDTVLVVTSSFHTARTRRIFRKLAQGYPVVLLASADYHLYDPNAWWSNRESRKLWFNEWIKTFFTAYELWSEKPELGKAEYQGLTPDPSATSAGFAMPAAAVEKASHATADSAARAAAEKPTGKDAPKEGAGDSLKAERRGIEGTDSTRVRKDSAQGASKDTLGAEGTRTGEAVRTGMETQRTENQRTESKATPAATATPASTVSAREAAKETEAKKAPAHAAKKPTASGSKTQPKHEEKKPEKSKKKS
jgi:uncharacterized SAM-binding protein YcdF (DUF218 family)